jgi:hypothetical protein
MTTPDIAGLCERLRADTPVHNRGPDYAPIMVEPGPLRLRAADTLERQAAELERLREALGNLIRMNEEHNAAVEKVMGRPLNWSDNYLNEARTALTGKEI